MWASRACSATPIRTMSWARRCSRVERGVGRRPGSAGEGFRRGGLMATYLIGPLLVLNPPFTKWLLRELGAKSDDLAFEDTAVAAYNARLAEFRDEKINYVF